MASTWLRGTALLTAFLFLAATAAPTPQDVLQAEQARQSDVATQREAAARALAAAEQARMLGEQRAEAAARLREAEDALGHAASQVADLTQRRQAATARLQHQAAALAPMLPVIERLALYPTETLLAVPMPPDQAVRGLIVLSGITQALEHNAAALRAEEAEVAKLQAQLDAAMPGLQQAEADQQRLAATLDADLAQTQAARLDAEDAAAQAAQRAAADAARADSLRTAIDRIETDRRIAEARAREEAAAAERHRQEAEAAAAHARQEALAQPPGPGVGEARGQLTAPVAGSLVRGFGAATETGPANGLTYQAAPAARVVSPCGGRVVFAGPFRSFGLLAIVDCGGGYHFVLSGLDRLDAQVGQRLQPGEPVGVMPAWDPNHPPATRPTLYVELRHDGAPVDPAPFLRARG
jgi:septal ring factor EnvC (AmiA/AmiB activator)